MGFFNRFLLLCSVLFTLGSIAHSWKLEDDTWPKKFERSGNETLTLLGTGLEQNQLIFIECRGISSPFCTIHTRNHENCKVILGNKKTNYVDKIYQVTNSKVIITSDNNLISFIDIDKCKVMKNLQFNNTDMIGIIYENGYDVFTSTNKRVRFDLNGNQIDKPKDFKLPKTIAGMYPVSPRWRSKGFFYANSNATHFTVSIILDDGTEDKQLLEIGAHDVIVHDASKQYFTICWNNVTIGPYMMKCAQYDELGNEKFKKTLDNPETERVIGVRNLRNGGFVRFSYLKNLTKIHVTAMYLDREPEESMYDIDAATEEILLADFYEKDGTFVLAYVPADLQGKGFALQKYKLPGMLGEHTVKMV